MDDAIRALREARPNGRDYYPQGPDAYRTASDEHEIRIARLELVQTELEQLIEAVRAQTRLKRTEGVV